MKYSEVLIQGNMLAKTWARKILGRRKLSRFLAVLSNPASAPLHKISKDQVKAILDIPVKDRKDILAIDEVTQEVYDKFEKMALKLAYKYALFSGRTREEDRQDIVSEARKGLLKAIRGYSSKETQFSTYAHITVQNEISRYLQYGMGILSGINYSLLVRYERKRDELAKASAADSFEDVCRELQLKKGEISRLKRALAAKVTHESEMENDLASVLADHRQNTSVDQELLARIGQVELKVLEKYAFISQQCVRELFPDAFPSLKAVAEHFGVSNANVGYALKSAKKKLAAALGKDFRR